LQGKKPADFKSAETERYHYHPQKLDLSQFHNTPAGREALNKFIKGQIKLAQANYPERIAKSYKDFYLSEIQKVLGRSGRELKALIKQIPDIEFYKIQQTSKLFTPSAFYSGQVDSETETAEKKALADELTAAWQAAIS